MACQDPLPLKLPTKLSDETVAELAECLYELARCLENRYFAQLHRHYHPDDPRPPSLLNDEETTGSSRSPGTSR